MEPDLMSLVVRVAPAEPVTKSPFLGRAIYRAFLHYVSQHDPNLAQSWHDTRDFKPFTCSMLVGGKRQGANGRLYTPDTPAWLRWTGLNKEVCHWLTRFASKPPEVLEIDNTLFQIVEIATAPQAHEWAQQTSYEALAAPYLLAQKRTNNKSQLEFVTPTTFRNGGRCDPLPRPERIFSSLARKWELFAPVQLPPEVMTVAQEEIIVRHFDLRTKAVQYKENAWQIGFIGKAAFGLWDADPFWTGVIQMLCDFAFYAGIGSQTASGLGQTRRIERNGRLHVAQGNKGKRGKRVHVAEKI